MAKNFNELLDRMSPKARVEVEERAQAMLAEMPLCQLRQALRLSQEQLASMLRVRQGTISKLERRTDMFISTLRRFIEAMGGELEINARFPEGRIRISQFKDMEAGGDDKPGPLEAKERVVTG